MEWSDRFCFLNWEHEIPSSKSEGSQLAKFWILDGMRSWICLTLPLVCRDHVCKSFGLNRIFWIRDLAIVCCDLLSIGTVYSPIMNERLKFTRFVRHRMIVRSRFEKLCSVVDLCLHRIVHQLFAANCLSLLDILSVVPNPWTIGHCRRDRPSVCNEQISCILSQEWEISLSSIFGRDLHNVYISFIDCAWWSQ
jgi:hypothetical protein